MESLLKQVAPAAIYEAAAGAATGRSGTPPPPPQAAAATVTAAADGATGRRGTPPPSAPATAAAEAAVGAASLPPSQSCQLLFSCAQLGISPPQPLLTLMADSVALSEGELSAKEVVRGLWSLAALGELNVQQYGWLLVQLRGAKGGQRLEQQQLMVVYQAQVKGGTWRKRRVGGLGGWDGRGKAG